MRSRTSTAFLSVASLLAFGWLALGSPVHPAHEASTASVASVSAAQSLEASFYSASLGRQMPFAIYLPPGYDSAAQKRYPVLYMLHGLGGNHDDWRDLGLFDAATRLIDSGQIVPLIIVTPEGESGYWVDHADGGPRYGSYISKDLVGYIDSHYRTVEGAARAIGGMSMGGHGALQLALNNPGEFEVVGAHSVALRTKEQAFSFFGDQQYYEAHDPMSLTSRSPRRAAGLQIWIDIGSSDTWLARASDFDQQLRSQGISHAWHVWAGGHDAGYWSAHVVDYLLFYGGALDSVGATGS